MSDLDGGPQPVTTPPWVRWWVVACIVCVFGPYVVLGLRTEQVAMYGSAGAIVATQAPRLWRFLAPAASVLALWGCYAIVAVIAALLTENRTTFDSGSLMAGLDNVFLPLATIVTFAFWRTLCAGHELLRVASIALVVAMSVNAVVAIVTTFAGIDLPGLSRFWAAGGTDQTVATLAADNGRFSGLFNQPAEAGIAYSLAAFALLYLVRIGRVARWKHLLAWLLLIIGGLLTLSKVFVVGGIAAAAVMIVTDRSNRARMALTGAGTVGAMVGATSIGKTGGWGASGMLDWYTASIAAGDSPLYTLSAGRFGSTGEVALPTVPVPGTVPAPGTELAGPEGLASIAAEVLANHPMFGLGARGLQVSYDSTWGETVVTGGLVGLVLILAVHAFLAFRTLRLRGRLATPEWIFALAVVTLVLGSSFGMPSLTGNRESTLLWIFLGLLVLSPATASLRTSRVSVRPRTSLSKADASSEASTSRTDR